MRVATVYGAAGFIGSSVVQRLRDRGMDVRTVKRGDPDPPPGLLGHTIYCIGLTSEFRTRPFETIDAHICKLRNLLERDGYASFLYLSSSRVYKGAISTAEEADLKVNPTNPDNLYNLSKLIGESLCLQLPNPAIRIARLSNVYGVGDRSQNFLSSVTRDAITKGVVEMRTAPGSAKDYISIDDASELLIQIALGGKHRLYNVASGRNVEHITITDSLTALTGCKVNYLPDAPQIVFPTIEIKRIRDEFGICPLPLEPQIADLIACEKENMHDHD